MKLYKLLSIGLLFTAVVGCNPTLVKTKTESDLDNEDLSLLRKSYLKELGKTSTESESGKVEIKDIPDNYEEVTPTYDLAEEMDSVLRIMENNKAEVNRVKGFAIQVFSGDRDQAFYAKNKVYTVLPGVEPSIEYYQPSYRVKVGEYFTQLDALEDFSVLKETFVHALIVPIKIPISHLTE